LITKAHGIIRAKLGVASIEPTPIEDCFGVIRGKLTSFISDESEGDSMPAEEPPKPPIRKPEKRYIGRRIVDDEEPFA
jgi:hypothetical protein